MTLHNLSETPILSITGDKAITDLNVIHCFNYLSMRTEMVEEERLKQMSNKKTRIL